MANLDAGIPADEAGELAAENAPIDPKAEAEAVGLVYLSDRQTPGITRDRVGPPESKVFRYRDAKGAEIAEPRVLDRIRALAIPPAWEQVWISPRRNGHLQATGIDAKGRKQYRYHPDWMKRRGETKFHRLYQFGQQLPAIRRHIERVLNTSRPRLDRIYVLSALIGLLDRTLIRIGNTEYASTNNSYGLTTLRNTHLKGGTTRLRFEFVGKSGIVHQVAIEDKRLARLVRACRDLPGQDLFQYRTPTGEAVPIRSQDVNTFLQELTGGAYTAKDFRTWGGSAYAIEAFLALPDIPASETGQTRAVNDVLRQVARRLGNTLAVCRKYYVHPLVIEAWKSGLLPDLQSRYGRRWQRWLRPSERLLLGLLQQVQQVTPGSVIKANRPQQLRQAT